MTHKPRTTPCGKARLSPATLLGSIAFGIIAPYAEHPLIRPLVDLVLTVLFTGIAGFVLLLIFSSIFGRR